MHWVDLVLHLKHLGLWPSHLVLEALQLPQDRYVLLVLAGLAAAGNPGLSSSPTETEEGELFDRPMQSSPRRWQFAHPFGRSSHFTYTPDRAIA